MKISLDWVGDYIDLPEHASPAELARELTLKTVEVEGRTDTAEMLRHVVVGRIVCLEPHPSGATIATCDIGETRHATVVTRAQNLSDGAAVALALPGARINGRAVEATAVGGVLSEAYLCRAADLGLEALFPATGPTDGVLLDELDAAPGAQLLDVMSWADAVLEVDNKSLTNRPDLWGHYGIARELAAIYRVPLRPVASRPAAGRLTRAEGLVGTVDPQLCRRLMVVQFELEDSVESPMWLRARLARLGEHSVSLVVDLANYVMFATGQPLHVYDGDAIALPLSVGAQEYDTQVELLDGRSVLVGAGAPLVRDSKGPVAVAGIMGTTGSAVHAASRRFVLEAASFQPQPIRRAAQSLGLRTEAAARFEKGLDTQRVGEAVDLYLALLAITAPQARTTGGEDRDPSPTLGSRISVPLEFLNTRIGLAIGDEEIAATLEALGFETNIDATNVNVLAPTWRSTGDVSIPDDVLEEIARIHGYDAIPVASLGATFTHISPTAIKPIDRRLREQLAARAGMQEVVTYPWCADRLLRAVGFDASEGVGFEGAPAPDRASLRPSLIPNLLESAAQNLRYASAFDIFEVGTVFLGGEYVPFAGSFELMPTQAKRAAAMLVGEDGPALFLRAKGVLEMLKRHAHLVALEFAELDGRGHAWADGQCQLEITAGGRTVGTLALLGTRCKRLAGIDQSQVAAFELDLDGLQVHPTRDNAYQPVSDLPESEFDLSVVIPAKTVWERIAATALSVGGLVDRVGFVGEFRGSWVPEGRKSTTLRVTLRPRESTLTAEDIADAREAVLAALGRDFGAYLRV